MAESKIEWCHFTHNPWWGCSKIAPECDNCYADTWAKRTGHKVWGPSADRRFFGLEHHKKPFLWNAKAEREGTRFRVFCASMADVFERRSGEIGALLDGERARLWVTIESTPHLDWMLLTKRPENMTRLTPEHWRNGWPSNVWAGMTAGAQATLERGVRALLDVPGVIHWLSCEPLLESLDVRRWLSPCSYYCDHGVWPQGHRPGPGIDLIIAGAESGHGARPMQDDWARSLRDQCVEAGVRFFFKQRLDERGRKVSLPLLDGEQWTQLPEART